MDETLHKVLQRPEKFIPQKDKIIWQPSHSASINAVSQEGLSSVSKQASNELEMPPQLL
jgi:hypothetical protein